MKIKHYRAADMRQALRQVRGVFDFTMPRNLVWTPDPADAPDNPPYVWLP